MLGHAGFFTGLPKPVLDGMIDVVKGIEPETGYGTIMHHGTPQQKEYFLPRMLSGDVRLSLGYTEPSGGTDLAGLKSSARKDGPLLIGLACRSAMRRGRVLGIAEQQTLITALANVSAPAVCPHGSPILLHYSRTFLIDKFDW